MKKINLKWFCIVGTVTLFSLLSFYIYQVNAQASEKYSIQDSQNRISDILEENKDLEINSAQASSLESIAQMAKELEFEKADKIHYIQIIDTQVVTK